MEKICLPDELQRSYANFLEYPTNIPLSGTGVYHSTLQSLKDRLDQIEPDLCLSREYIDEFEVPIRDLGNASGKVEKANIHTPEKLSQWLAARVVSFEKERVAAYKRDPKCRFIYIYAQNSRDQLKITRNSLAEIFTYHQVMPVYLDFIFVFGAQSDATDLRFSGFREQTVMKHPPRAPCIPELGRSGRYFQLCYNLKGVTLKLKHADNPRLDEWSIRQAAIYHQFDVVYGTTLWIVTKGRLDIQQRYKDLTGTDGRPEDKSYDTAFACFRSSLAAHLLYCHWSTESWRWYIRWMEGTIEAESAMAIYGPRGPGFAHMEYKPYHIQDLQYWLDKINEAVAMMEANIDIISALRRFYTGLVEQADFPILLQEQNADDLTEFGAQLNDLINHFKMQLSRARFLANITRDRKELVLQHLQGQTAERMEELNANMEKEAIGMRVITVATLLYLPATFVSTFFGTDVVKYQNGKGVDSAGTFSPTALTRWLEVTIPLTITTLILSWAMYKMSSMKRRFRGLQQKNPADTPSTWRLSVGSLARGIRVRIPQAFGVYRTEKPETTMV